MSINKAMYTGVNAIMDAFDRNALTPYFSVWAGKDMIFSHNEDDNEQGRVYLMENLIASEQNEHSDILKIKFHPKKEKLFITDKTPAIATLFVRVCDPNYFRNTTGIQPYQQQQQQPNFAMQNLIEKQIEILSGISNRLSLLEEQQEEEEEEDDDFLGKIGAILNNPMVATFISSIMPAIMPALNNTIKPQVAGIRVDPVLFEDNFEEAQEKEMEVQLDRANEIEEALHRLHKHTNDLAGNLTALADLADHNPSQFKMFIAMLVKPA